MGVIIISIFVSLVGVGIFLYHQGTEWMVKRKFRANKIKPFNLIKDGDFVKVKGIAKRHDAVLRAPLSQEQCLCYYVFANLKGTKWQASTVWGKDFWIECEGGGKVLIKTDNVLPYFKESYRFTQGAFSAVPEHIEKYLNRHGRSYREGKLECSETILYEGDQLVAMGFAKWRNKNTPDEYVVLKTGGKAIYLSNLLEWRSDL